MYIYIHTYICIYTYTHIYVCRINCQQWKYLVRKYFRPLQTLHLQDNKMHFSYVEVQLAMHLAHVLE